MERRYATLDVFSGTPLTGNPLAVVLDGAGISDQRMQQIAGEFNLSETVFVTSFDKDQARAQIRIFTPLHELPFAGHPTVGTAVLLARERQEAGNVESSHEILLEEMIGPVSCNVALGAQSSSATFTLPQLSESCGHTGGDNVVAEALGLRVGDIGFDAHQTCQWSAGVPYSLVPVSGLEAISNITPNDSPWTDAFGEGHHNNAFVYCRECVDPENHFHARMFWPGAGIREDPATGSAIAAFSGLVMQKEKPDSGTHTFTIEQGYEMGRPSLIRLELVVERDALVEARIGGEAVVVARGRLLI